MSRRLVLPFLFLTLFFQFQCSGGSGFDPGDFGHVPLSWSKFMAVGSVTATLVVYDEGGSIIKTGLVWIAAALREILLPRDVEMVVQ